MHLLLALCTFMTCMVVVPAQTPPVYAPCFTAEEMAEAERLLSYPEIRIYVKMHGYEAVARRYWATGCNLNPLSSTGIVTAAEKLHLLENRNIRAVREILITTRRLGYGDSVERLWAALAIEYDLRTQSDSRLAQTQKKTAPQ